MQVIFTGYEIVHRDGLVLKFIVDGVNYERVSMLNTVNNFKKGMLLWWKRNNEWYLTEEETDSMEDMAESYFKTYSFPIVKLIDDGR